MRPSAATARAQRPAARPRARTPKLERERGATSSTPQAAAESALRAAGELAGIGLTLASQAVRGIASRIPRP